MFEVCRSEWIKCDLDDLFGQLSIIPFDMDNVDKLQSIIGNISYGLSALRHCLMTEEFTNGENKIMYEEYINIKTEELDKVVASVIKIRNT